MEIEIYEQTGEFDTDSPEDLLSYAVSLAAHGGSGVLEISKVHPEMLRVKIFLRDDSVACFEVTPEVWRAALRRTAYC
jgi:hypothetical protein